MADKRSFVTTDGKEWTLSITYGTVKRLRTAAGVDFNDLSRDRWSGLGDLLADLEKFVGALWVLVESQAVAAGVAPEAFAELLDGDAIEAAANAFVGAVADFAPSQSRALLLALAAKGRAVADLAARTVTEEVAAVDPRTILDRLTASASSEPASPTPASADSTPTPEPSGN